MAITEFPRPSTSEWARVLHEEMRPMIALGTPLALGELGWMSTYIVDAIMVGRMPHSALAISASTLGNTIFYVILFFAGNLLLSLDTLVAQAFGRGDTKDCLFSLTQSMFLVAALSPAVMVATHFSLPLLHYAKVNPAVILETRSYLSTLNWSTVPLLLYIALRRYLQAIDRPAIVMISLLTANLVNLAADWILIYGHLGVRAMGIAGSGLATVWVRIYMLVLLAVAVAIYTWREKLHIELLWLIPDWSRIRALLIIGWPTGIQSLAELGVSTFSTILVARLSITLIAAHGVVLDLNALTYMIPLGISSAAAVRVGQAYGRGDYAGVRRAGYASVLFACGVMIVCAVAFLTMPRLLAHIYTTDAAVIRASVPIFFICAGFQLFDAVQVTLTGALRGIGQTRWPMVVNVACYWILAMPLSMLLAFHFHMGLVGIWLGRSAGVIVIGSFLFLMWQRAMQKGQQMAPAILKTLPGANGLHLPRLISRAG